MYIFGFVEIASTQSMSPCIFKKHDFIYDFYENLKNVKICNFHVIFWSTPSFFAFHENEDETLRLRFRSPHYIAHFSRPFSALNWLEKVLENGKKTHMSLSLVVCI